MKFEVSSELQLTTEDVEGLLTMEGVNRELRPVIQMTAPPEWASKPIAEWPTGRVLFSSWILLFGLLPIDRHTFLLQSVDWERGFSEASTSLSNKVWHHRREIEFKEHSCVLTDTVEFEPRVAFLACILGPVYRLVFRHRHKFLRARFGGRS